MDCGLDTPALEIGNFKVETSSPKFGVRKKGCVLAQTIWMETESGTEWVASKCTRMPTVD